MDRTFDGHRLAIISGRRDLGGCARRDETASYRSVGTARRKHTYNGLDDRGNRCCDSVVDKAIALFVPQLAL